MSMIEDLELRRLVAKANSNAFFFDPAKESRRARIVQDRRADEEKKDILLGLRPTTETNLTLRRG